jgi:hypothetical protein
MSQGTPPRKTLQENSGFLLFLGGSCPLQVNVASFTADKKTLLKPPKINNQQHKAFLFRKPVTKETAALQRQSMVND